MSSNGHSSSDIAVSVRGLSKSYSIAHNTAKHTTAGEALMHRLRHPFAREERETFWALNDVSFDIQKGDVVGIIGRNGAGKSTLLKILSRITEPTQGRIDLYGRVGSLLEVGTGFHAELTGRENIFLNGAILGMSRAEIARQFDAIVDFSGTEQFLDTPVKRYSSGMYVRLAFAVAAHLNPEILIVDEVLAVGDAEFQKKCLGKMKDVAQSGRTVLFVSHNMQAISMLCNISILLHHGRIVFAGDTERSISKYSTDSRFKQYSFWQRDENLEASALTINSISAELTGEQPQHTLDVEVKLRTKAAHQPAFLAIDIFDATGSKIMQALPSVEGFVTDASRQHTVKIPVCLPPLIPGHYLIGVWVGSHNTETLDEVEQCVGFEVTQSPTKGRTYPHSPYHGYIVPEAGLQYLPEEVDL